MGHKHERDFYPRPPRGGRPLKLWSDEAAELFLSTPSARRATGSIISITSSSGFLSTPSARRATPQKSKSNRNRGNFYPRPPRGGRPSAGPGRAERSRFLSTPSARRAQCSCRRRVPPAGISIHALREEGDLLCGSCWGVLSISIHALREEGDIAATARETIHGDFYPRPPRGGRPPFLFWRKSYEQISIHALREEGDTVPSSETTSVADFYPRPPRGGRP